ncbi:UNKNOWN [Stylonychia lemnae]|uniref:Uncharacterized protein n=1 Tax=Stylonychia lemnae TaxID=5949 RepID=A0A078ARM3_STYLE|nr:UNKNOWN [Stylonychia lemnae]|eukprot:CDW83857.1 UNKNOWN [Stylonychia lemnae]
MEKLRDQEDQENNSFLSPKPLISIEQSANRDNKDKKLKRKPNDAEFKSVLQQFEKGYKNGEHDSQRSPQQHPTGQSPNKTENKQFFANEIDWFGFQTQLRKIVYELVEPTVKRALTSENQIYFLQEENAQVRKKLDELEYVFQKAQKKAVSNDDITRKIHEQDQNRRIAELKLKGEIDQFKASMDSFKQRLQVVESEAVRYQTSTQLQQIEVSAVVDNFHGTKQKLHNEMIQMHDTFVRNINELKEKIEFYDQPVKRCEQYLENQKIVLRDLQTGLEIAKKDLLSHNSEIKRLDKQKLDEDIFNDDQKIIKNHMGIARQEIDLLKSELQATDNYLDKYLPFKTLNFIYDSLTAFLDKKELAKLFDYLAVIFEQLESGIANDDGKPSLTKRDFFIPTLDLSFIQQQRKLNKIMNEGGSEIRAGMIEQTQRSNSQISDMNSEAKNFSRLKSKRSAVQKQVAKQHNQNIMSSSNYADNVSQSTRKTLAHRGKQSEVKNRPLLPSRRESKQLSSKHSQNMDYDAYENEMTQKELLRVQKGTSQFEKDRNRQRRISSGSGRFNKIGQSKQNVEGHLKRQSILQTSQIEDLTLKERPDSEQGSPSFGKGSMKDKQSFKDLNDDRFDASSKAKDLFSRGRGSDAISYQNMDQRIQEKLTSSFPQILIDQQKILKNLIETQSQGVKEEQSQMEQKSQPIQNEAKQTSQEMTISHKLFSETRENRNNQIITHKPDPMNQESFQGATFHQSPNRSQRFQRQSSTDAAGNNSSFEKLKVSKSKVLHQNTELNHNEPMTPQGQNSSIKKQNTKKSQKHSGRNIQTEKVVGKEGVTEFNKEESDDQEEMMQKKLMNLQENDPDNVDLISDAEDEELEMEDYDENMTGSSNDTFSGNRVVNKKFRKLNVMIKKIRRMMLEYFSDQDNYNGKTSEQLAKINDVINHNEVLWRQDSERLTKLIINSLEQEKIKIKVELTEKYDDITEKIQEQLNETITRRKREISDNQFEMSKVNKIVEQNCTKIEVFGFQAQNMAEIQNAMLESLLIVNTIIAQDEEDRKSLSLVGISTIGGNMGGENHVLSNSKPEESRQMIKLDKTCMTCSNQNNPIIKSAFKMACLAYQPRPVEFAGQKVPKDVLANRNKVFVEKLLTQYQYMLKVKEDKIQARNLEQNDENQGFDILPEILQVDKISYMLNNKSKMNKSISDFSSYDNTPLHGQKLNPLLNKSIANQNHNNSSLVNVGTSINDISPSMQEHMKYLKMNILQQANPSNNASLENFMIDNPYLLLYLIFNSLNKKANLNRMTDAILHDRTQYEGDKVHINFPKNPSFEMISKRAKTPLLQQSLNNQNYKRLAREKLKDISTQLTTNRPVTNINSLIFYSLQLFKFIVWQIIIRQNSQYHQYILKLVINRKLKSKQTFRNQIKCSILLPLLRNQMLFEKTSYDCLQK